MTDLTDMEKPIDSANVNECTIRFQALNNSEDHRSDSKLSLAVCYSFTVAEDKLCLFLINLHKLERYLFLK